MWSEIIAIIISGISLVFAYKSFKKSHNIEKRQLEIEEVRHSKERAASLVGYFHCDGKRRTLRIENKGNAEARSIKVKLDGKPIEEHPCWIQNQPNMIEILPGEGFGDYILALTSSNPFPKIVEIYWEDDVKKDNVSRSSLTV